MDMMVSCHSAANKLQRCNSLELNLKYSTRTNEDGDLFVDAVKNYLKVLYKNELARFFVTGSENFSEKKIYRVTLKSRCSSSD